MSFIIINIIHCQQKVNKRMSTQSTNQKKQSQSEMCLKCKQFWGNKDFEGLCSTCFTKTGKPIPKKQKQEPEIKIVNQKQKYKGKDRGVQEDTKKCFYCSRKIGLLGTPCKCGYVYCNQHRMPEDHDCSYNFQAQGKDKVKKQNQKIDNGKIKKIQSII